MKIFWKVARWIIVIIATASILGFLLEITLTTASTDELRTGLWVSLFWLLAGGTALYLEIRTIKTKKEIKQKNSNHSTIENKTTKNEDELKIYLIKLGFEKVNGFKLANKDMYEMNQKQLEKYYKLGLKVLNKK